MATAPVEISALDRLRATLGIFITLAGAVCGIALLYLGMRSVMNVGGFCAEGGAFEIRQHCPKGVVGVMFMGIWGGLIFIGLYVWQTVKWKVPSLVALSWSALFLSLGWNFLDYGLNPPPPMEGLIWGWLVCAIAFGLMGGLPLIVVLPAVVRGFTKPDQELPASPTTPRERVHAAVTRVSAPGATTAAPTGPVWTQDEPSGSGLVSELERLEALHRSGGLSDEEFAAAKKKVLG